MCVTEAITGLRGGKQRAVRSPLSSRRGRGAVGCATTTIWLLSPPILQCGSARQPNQMQICGLINPNRLFRPKSSYLCHLHTKNVSTFGQYKLFMNVCCFTNLSPDVAVSLENVALQLYRHFIWLSLKVVLQIRSQLSFQVEIFPDITEKTFCPFPRHLKIQPARFEAFLGVLWLKYVTFACVSAILKPSN